MRYGGIAMKKFITFILALSIALVSASCGQVSEIQEEASVTPAPAQTDEPIDEAIEKTEIPVESSTEKTTDSEEEKAEPVSETTSSAEPAKTENTTENPEPVDEDKTPWLADYDTFWKIVEENYALYNAAKRITKNDFVQIKEDYRAKAMQAQSATELFEIIRECLETFQGVGHLQLIYNKEHYRLYTTDLKYFSDEGRDVKMTYLYNRLINPASIEFYGFDPETELESTQSENTLRTATKHPNNIQFKDFPDAKTAYVSIAQMTHEEDNNDTEVLRDWFETIEEKGYQDCIIDIRGNGGGDSNYWMNNITLPNSTKPCNIVNYMLVKGTECFNYWQTIGRKLMPIENLPREKLPKLLDEDLEGVTHFMEFKLPHLVQSDPLFSGRFWLLVDEEVYSSSEMFAVYCKNTKFATIIGEPTGGDGVGEDPLFFSLPNTGICFRFSAEEGLNLDGSCNEEFGTQPDIAIQPGEDALDVCLKAIREQTQDGSNGSSTTA